MIFIESKILLLLKKGQTVVLLSDNYFVCYPVIPDTVKTEMEMTLAILTVLH